MGARISHDSTTGTGGEPNESFDLLRTPGFQLQHESNMTLDRQRARSVPDFQPTSSQSQIAEISTTTSVPSHIWTFNGIKCPVCNKLILPGDIECHLLICLTKPRLSYNEDILGESKGECIICLENLNSGDIIARLPCLCVYHKGCIDRWFQVNRSCPEHPGNLLGSGFVLE